MSAADSIGFLKNVKRGAIVVAVSTVTCILAVMVLAGEKIGDDGDIAGVVAPALLLTCVSGVVAAIAAVRQKRAQRMASHTDTEMSTSNGSTRSGSR